MSSSHPHIANKIEEQVNEIRRCLASETFTLDSINDPLQVLEAIHAAARRASLLNDPIASDIFKLIKAINAKPSAAEARNLLTPILDQLSARIFGDGRCSPIDDPWTQAYYGPASSLAGCAVPCCPCPSFALPVASAHLDKNGNKNPGSDSGPK